MRRPLPRPSGRSMALLLNAALGLLALGLAFAPSGEGAPKLELAAASGSLTLKNSKEGLAILQPGEMRPGEQAGGSVTITNTGTVNAALTLQPELGADAPGLGGGQLSSALELLVIDVSDPAEPVTVYEGTLKRMAATNVGSLGPGAARTYVFVASLPARGPADNAYQGATVSTGFRWDATSVASATPVPTTTPAPTATPRPTVAPPPPATVSGTGTGGTGAAAPAEPPAPVTLPGADPAGEVLGAQLFVLPAASRGCVGRRAFAIRVRRPAGMTFTSLAVTVNGRPKVRLKGDKAGRVKTTVTLRGLPAGKVTVRITAVMGNGRKAVSTRTYTTCAAKKRAKRPRR